MSVRPHHPRLDEVSREENHAVDVIDKNEKIANGVSIKNPVIFDDLLDSLGLLLRSQVVKEIGSECKAEAR